MQVRGVIMLLFAQAQTLNFLSNIELSYQTLSFLIKQGVSGVSITIIVFSGNRQRLRRWYSCTQGMLGFYWDKHSMLMVMAPNTPPPPQFLYKFMLFLHYRTPRKFLGGLHVTNPTIRLACPSVRPSVCLSVCLSVNISLVNTITREILIALPNLYHGCISGVSWLSSKMDDLDPFFNRKICNFQS